jgi:hypothetical protein
MHVEHRKVVRFNRGASAKWLSHDGRGREMTVATGRLAHLHARMKTSSERFHFADVTFGNVVVAGSTFESTLFLVAIHCHTFIEFLGESE